MKKKVLAAREALQGGTAGVIIADGRVPDPISKGLEGAGTLIQ
jgi:acetylglutamate/LysW-gamma-L-alpha-aminoadipate kinase